jgi:hypothetical protein
LHEATNGGPDVTKSLYIAAKRPHALSLPMFAVSMAEPLSSTDCRLRPADFYQKAPAPRRGFRFSINAAGAYLRADRKNTWHQGDRDDTLLVPNGVAYHGYRE